MAARPPLPQFAVGDGVLERNAGMGLRRNADRQGGWLSGGDERRDIKNPARERTLDRPSHRTVHPDFGGEVDAIEV